MIQKLIIGWLINQVIAWITRWLDGNQPTSRIQQHEKPQPIVKPKAGPQPKGGPHKLPPVDTRPGHFNRETGTFNE